MFPIYIPSKGRGSKCTTAMKLDKAGIPYTLVVEKEELGAYSDYAGRKYVLAESGRGLGYSKHEILKHSKENGEQYHWCIDDDMQSMCHLVSGYIEVGAWDYLLQKLEEEIFPLLSSEKVFLAGPSYRQLLLADPEEQFTWNRHLGTFVLVNSNAPINYDPSYRCRQDIRFTLDNLHAGWKSLRHNWIGFGSQTMGDGKGFGGNQELYRQNAQVEYVNRVVAAYPDICKPRMSDTGDTRLAVNWRRLDQKLATLAAGRAV